MQSKTLIQDFKSSSLFLLFLFAISTTNFFAHSHAQFSTLNFLYVCLFGISSLIFVISEKNGTKPQLLGLLGLVVGASFLLSSLASGRFIPSLTGQATSLAGLFSLLAIAAGSLYAKRFATEIVRVLKAISPYVVLVVIVGMFIQGPTFDAEGTLIDAAVLGFANSSELGIYVALLFPFLLSSDRLNFKGETWLRYAIAALTLFVFFTDAVRIPLILCSAYSLWYFISLSPLSKKVRKSIVIIGIILIALLLIALLVMETLDLISVDLFSTRAQLARLALDAFADKPLLGYGADGFVSGAGGLEKTSDWWGGDPFILGEGSTDPHNILLLLLVSFGALGTIAFLAWCALSLKEIFKRNSDFLESFKPQVLAALGGALLFHTQPSSIPLLTLLGIMWALALNPEDNSKALNMQAEKSAKSAKASKSAKNTALLAQDKQKENDTSTWIVLRISLSALALLVLLFASSNALARLSLSAVSNNRSAPLERALKARAFAAYDPYMSMRLNQSVLAHYASLGDKQAFQNVYSTLNTEALIMRDSYSAELPLAQAEAYLAMEVQQERAEELLHLSLSRYPEHPFALARLIEISLARGDMDAAREYSQGILKLGEMGQRNFGVLLDQVDLEK